MIKKKTRSIGWRYARREIPQNRFTGCRLSKLVRSDLIQIGKLVFGR